jgi:hypothetical protein
MSHLDPKRPATTSELRKFGLMVGGVFALIGGLTYYHDRPIALIATLATLGGALILGGALAPRALAQVYVGWMKLAVLLSKVTTPILMGIIYFLLVAPLGLLMRAFGKHPLGAGTTGTMWVTRAVDDRRSDLERQF